LNDDDLFLQRLRRDAIVLRYEPADELLWRRLQSGVRDRIATTRATPSVTQLLAAWMRPVAASLLILALAGSVVVGVESRYHEKSITPLDALSQPPSDLPSLYEDLLSAGD
jgi:hypothetical protein